MSDETKQDTSAAAAVPAVVGELVEGRIPEAVMRRGITESAWRTLCNNLFPGANPRSVLMVVDYCIARKLDPLKKPCHIVPMNVKDSRSGEYVWRDVVMPGIYEFRTTAHRTGQYLGHSKPEYASPIEYKGVTAPEYCDMVIYKQVGATKVEFPVRCYFREVVATDQHGKVNSRWTRAPIQMTTKCTEAAGLREAFPEELGGEHTDDEMAGRAVDMTPSTSPSRAPVLTVFDGLPEAVQDSIERAFAALNMTEAQRLVRLNEHLGGEGTDPELGSVALLKWCHDETVRRQTTSTTKGTGNGKTTKTAGPTDPGTERNHTAGSDQGKARGPVTAPDAGAKPADSVSVSSAVPASTAASVTSSEIFGSRDDALGF